MPSKSAKQFRFMAGMANGMKNTTGGIGPSEDVAEEMVKKTKPAKRSMFMKKKKKSNMMMDNE